MNQSTELHRKIRSFVRRQGRIRPGQQRALTDLWAQYGLEANDKIDFDTVFQRKASRVLEIGFGMGQSLLEMATKNPEQDYIGIEVHRPGIGALLAAIAELKLTNIRVFCADALEVLERCIADGVLDTVQLFFPDPWPKKRHHKRRIVQDKFLALSHQKLKPTGKLHMATDWEEYANHMLEVMSAKSDFANLAGEGNFSPRPDSRPLTKFEARGIRLGHGVWDLIFIKP